MTKYYDCSKTLDYYHELERICSYYKSLGSPVGSCANCPLAYAVKDKDCGAVTQLHIDALQRWSYEHPETIHLTTIESSFLHSFSDTKYLQINRDSSGDLWLVEDVIMDAWSIKLDSNLFKFIGEDETWTFSDLLSLENTK